MVLFNYQVNDHHMKPDGLWENCNVYRKYRCDTGLDIALLLVLMLQLLRFLGHNRGEEASILYSYSMDP